MRRSSWQNVCMVWHHPSREPHGVASHADEAGDCKASFAVGSKRRNSRVVLRVLPSSLCSRTIGQSRCDWKQCIVGAAQPRYRRADRDLRDQRDLLVAELLLFMQHNSRRFSVLRVWTAPLSPVSIRKILPPKRRWRRAIS
jgi:hypothetical protein